MNNFAIISTVTPGFFLEKWTEAEKYNSDHNRHDQDAWNRIKSFSNKKLNIYLIEIAPDKTFNQIIIPYHAARDHYFKTGQGGNSLEQFIDKYSYKDVVKNSRDICSESILYHINLFGKQKASGQLFINGVFIYCTQYVELAVGQDKRQGNFLYAGGFHQFAAYGLFVKEFGPIPLRLYYM